jgi:hypothetical protein
MQAASSPPLEAGRVFEVAFPFVLERVELPPDDPEATSMAEVDSWRPGVQWDDDGRGNSVAAADAIGAMLLTVVSVHRPGKFPTRVFYTRQWRDPTGKMFGKQSLRVTTSQAFKRRIRGYAHEYELSEPSSDAAGQDGAEASGTK